MVNHAELYPWIIAVASYKYQNGTLALAQVPAFVSSVTTWPARVAARVTERALKFIVAPLPGNWSEGVVDVVT